jgi:hypothetical protein
LAPFPGLLASSLSPVTSKWSLRKRRLNGVRLPKKKSFMAEIIYYYLQISAYHSSKKKKLKIKNFKNSKIQKKFKKNSKIQF